MRNRTHACKDVDSDPHAGTQAMPVLMCVHSCTDDGRPTAGPGLFASSTAHPHRHRTPPKSAKTAHSILLIKFRTARCFAGIILVQSDARIRTHVHTKYAYCIRSMLSVDDFVSSSIANVGSSEISRMRSRCGRCRRVCAVIATSLV